MTTETKKYRRRVSDERVDRVVNIVTKQHPVRHDFCQMDYTMVSDFSQLPEYLKDRERKRVRAVLEADEKVIDAVAIEKWKATGTDMVSMHRYGGASSMTAKQFHAEWEEIPND
jgi:hypothetical protein